MGVIEDIIIYSFLGLLQGLTEPIPISSSGHLVLAQEFLGLKIEGLSFEVLMNFASLLAVLLIYKKELVALTSGSWQYIRHRKSENRAEFRFVVYLLIATIPAAVIGLIFNDFISNSLKGVQVVGVTLIITGIALWLIRNMQGSKQDKDLTLKDSIIVGLAQAIALIPGISRSGATIVAAMSLGMKQQTALKFSFFLYIPISLGSMLLEGSQILRDPELFRLALPYSAAFLLSLVASYFSLKWFMGIMARGRLKYFSIYCFVVGGLVVTYSLLSK